MAAFAAGIASCSAGYVTHDPDAAAGVASEFARYALIQGDSEGGYTFLSPDAKRLVSLAALDEALTRMHPASRPARVAATDFEPVPGSRSISVFLQGSNGGGEAFHYRITLELGTAGGYWVTGVYRGSGEYPSSPLRRSFVTGTRTANKSVADDP